MKYDMKEYLSAIDVLLSLALEQKNEYLGEESNNYCCEYNDNLKKSVHNYVKSFIENKIKRGEMPVIISLNDFYPIISSCSDFDDIFEGCWKKMDSYINKTFKIYDISHGAFIISNMENIEVKETSEVVNNESVKVSNTTISTSDNKNNSLSSVNKTDNASTIEKVNSSLITSSNGLYTYDATDLFKAVDGAFSHVVYDKNQYLFCEYGLTNHNYCTKYDDDLKNGVHEVIRGKIESMINAKSNYVSIDIMDIYEAIRNSTKFDRIFEGCRLWVETELEYKYGRVKKNHGNYVININKKVSNDSSNKVSNTDLNLSVTAEDFDTSKLETIIDNSISHIMYDKSHILFSQYGVRDKRYCTEYNDSLQEAVHGLIKKLISKKLLSSSSFTISTMEVYKEICNQPKFSKIFEGCSFEVKNYLETRFSSYDKEYGPFRFNSNEIGNKTYKR